MRAQTAEWKADTVISSVGQIADQAIRAWSTADDAIAEAHSVREQVESRIADMSQRTKIATSSMLGEVTGHVKEVVERSEAKTSRSIGDALQQLEQEIGVAASSATLVLGQATHMAVAEARREF